MGTVLGLIASGCLAFLVLAGLERVIFGPARRERRQILPTQQRVWKVSCKMYDWAEEKDL